MTIETLMTEAPTPSAAAASPAVPAASAPATAPAADATQQAAAQPQPSTPEPATTEAPATDKAEGDSKATEQAAPEKYEFKAPDGVTLDAELLGEFEGIARELKLSQEDAQKVADVGAKMAAKFEARQAEVVQQARADWHKQSIADKEFGGDSLAQNLAVAKKAMDTFGTPALRTLLDESGLGNHPEVIRAFVRAGKAISEDSMVTGRVGAPPNGRDPASALYPNQQH